ncbi:UNVERIFIED_CONTAM: hypothetical protein Sangu_1734400 [Sesamum angustifolium]|uniref:Uncharacterized protein n=1 Tax=Sesamum angustifolium TaxID=2727405 RepID=A0AAW2M524_9LAMI
MKGFVDGYYNWTAHGEVQVLNNYEDQLALVCSQTPVAPGMRTQWGNYVQMNWDQRIVYDTVGPQFFSMHQEPEVEGANSFFPADASLFDYDVSGLSEQFFNVVHATDQPLYSRCDQSQLAAIARLVNINAEHNMFERCYDQRLYASPATVEYMTWHANHVTEERSVCHPSNAEAWRHFDRTHPDFALEPHNVRLGL